MNYSKCLSVLLTGTALLATAGPPTAVTTIALGPQPPFQSALRMVANPGTNRIHVFNGNLPGLAVVAPTIAVINSQASSLVGLLQPAGISAANLVASPTRAMASKATQSIPLPTAFMPLMQVPAAALSWRQTPSPQPCQSREPSPV
jgi:hypothetical protein